LSRHFTSRVFNVFGDYALSMLQRPRALQIAALCQRMHEGQRQVLLITSRGSGRWIIPKGWTMRGKTAAQAAEIEAWEEAGVCPSNVGGEAIGSYTYHKVKRGGLPVPVEVLVYGVWVRSLSDDFPEVGQRKRAWMTPQEAAPLVAEPGLQDLLRSL
jgi:8-oxo-dGTP pyrophosphatase MutT (NUDIX family)